MYYLWHAIFVAEKYKEEKIYNLKRYLWKRKFILNQ